jgi:hypothetical protein
MHTYWLHAYILVTCIHTGYMHTYWLHAYILVTCIHTGYMHTYWLHAYILVTCIHTGYMQLAKLLAFSGNASIVAWNRYVCIHVCTYVCCQCKHHFTYVRYPCVHECTYACKCEHRRTDMFALYVRICAANASIMLHMLVIYVFMNVRMHVNASIGARICLHSCTYVCM